MQSLVKRNLNGIVLTGLLFAQVLMVGHQSRDSRGSTRLRHWTGALLLPLQTAASSASEFLAGGLDRYVWLVGVERENQRLDAEAARLRMENFFLQQKVVRFEGRQELEAYRTSLRSETLPASVVAHSPSRSVREIFVNRGRSHGVRPGMAVVTSEGIVGKVEDVYPWSSMVLLITDAEAGAAVMLSRSGGLAVLRGTGALACRLEHVGPHVRVSVGELVYTSGTDGVYPLGLPVGRVTKVEVGVDVQDIRLEPFAALDRLGEVLVLLKERLGVLPEEVRQAVGRVPQDSARDSGSVGLPLRGVAMDADRIKMAYRQAVESQGKKVGVLTYTARPLDFRAVSDPARAASEERTDDGALVP